MSHEVLSTWKDSSGTEWQRVEAPCFLCGGSGVDPDFGWGCFFCHGTGYEINDEPCEDWEDEDE